MAQRTEAQKIADQKYYQKNKDKRKEYSKKYYKENRESLLDKKKEYFQATKEYALFKRKEWYFNNREHAVQLAVDRTRNRRNNDPSFKFIQNLRRRQNHVLKGKASTTAGLGCTRQELRDYLAGLFQPGMTFDNHGKGEGCWHIDHIIPLSSHEKDSNRDWDSESQYNKQLIHYTNLQPLWEQDNLDKSNKIISYENTSNPSIRSNNKLS